MHCVRTLETKMQFELKFATLRYTTPDAQKATVSERVGSQLVAAQRNSSYLAEAKIGKLEWIEAVGNSTASPGKGSKRAHGKAQVQHMCSIDLDISFRHRNSGLGQHRFKPGKKVKHYKIKHPRVCVCVCVCVCVWVRVTVSLCVCVCVCFRVCVL